MKVTPKEKLQNRKICLPNAFVYDAARIFLVLNGMLHNVSHVFHFDKNDLKGKQIILLADHSSRISYMYVLGGFKEFRFNVVVGYQHFFQKFIFNVLYLVGAISKKTSCMDLKAVRDIFRVIQLGGNVAIFPEGVQSCSGTDEPTGSGIAALLKKAGLTVVLCKSYGAYLSYPRYNRRHRVGRQEYHYEILFTPEELETLSQSEVCSKFEDRFKYNDFEWNRIHKEKYSLRGSKNYLADGITSVLYKCPCCNGEFGLRTDKEHIICDFCGNDILLDETYTFQKTSDDTVLPYSNIHEWVEAQKAAAAEAVKDPDFCEEYDCYVETIREDRLTFSLTYVCGSGHVRIDRYGLHYIGEFKGKDIELFIDKTEMPGIYFAEAHSNDIFYQGEFYRFCPLELPERVSKFSFEIEALYGCDTNGKQPL